MVDAKEKSVSQGATRHRGKPDYDAPSRHFRFSFPQPLLSFVVAFRKPLLATIRLFASELDSASRLTRLVATGEGSHAAVSGCALAVTTSFFLGLRGGARGAGLGSTGAANTRGGAGLASIGAGDGGGFSAAAFKILSKADICPI